MSDLVPDRFRPALREVIDRVVAGDFEGLSRDGLVSGPGDVGKWVRDYPLRLVALPDEAWSESGAGPILHDPGSWWIVVPLWDEDGMSDLSFEATVREAADGSVDVQIDGIHVL